jgi:hypothetical protein
MKKKIIFYRDFDIYILIGIKNTDMLALIAEFGKRVSLSEIHPDCMDTLNLT